MHEIWMIINEQFKKVLLVFKNSFLVDFEIFYIFKISTWREIQYCNILKFFLTEDEKQAEWPERPPEAGGRAPPPLHLSARQEKYLS